MAILTGLTQIFSGDTAVIDSSARHNVGTRARDEDGNEYIYALGIVSTIAGNWVSFDEDLVTTRLTANAVGRVGIAMAAIVADKYGWYQIYGKNTIASSDTTVSDNKQLYIDATAGRVDDADVAGDTVIGAISRSTATSNVITVEINYPFVCNVALD